MTTELLKWYKKNKRDLPWRKTSDPYKIWVSEIILQQTQIKTGIKYYYKFLKKFPNITILSNAKEVDVLKTWEGLGYYNRALNMLNTAQTIKVNYNNIFPITYSKLIKLKGIGEYTAAAISSICGNEKRAVVDGNVYRVLSRIYNIDIPINTYMGKKKFQKLANKLIPNTNTGTYNQAIMDFGSIHCKNDNPKCNICPLKSMCQAAKLELVKERPVKKVLKNVKIRYLNYLFIQHQDCFIIQQRKTKDIWNKLYELPLIETKAPIIKKELRNSKLLKKLNVSNMEHQYQLIHILSHQKLIISFWKITIRDINFKHKLKTITLQDIEKYPFPKPLQKYFDKEHLII